MAPKSPSYAKSDPKVTQSDPQFTRELYAVALIYQKLSHSCLPALFPPLCPPVPLSLCLCVPLSRRSFFCLPSILCTPTSLSPQVGGIGRKAFPLALQTLKNESGASDFAPNGRLSKYFSKLNFFIFREKVVKIAICLQKSHPNDAPMSLK